MAGTAWVLNAAAHTLEDYLVGEVTHTDPVPGMGPLPAAFHGPIANNVGNPVTVPRLVEQSPQHQFYG